MSEAGSSAETQNMTPILRGWASVKLLASVDLYRHCVLLILAHLSMRCPHEIEIKNQSSVNLRMGRPEISMLACPSFDSLRDQVIPLDHTSSAATPTALHPIEPHGILTPMN